ncbi:hypothetical protein GJV26_27295 [Massilia dura]|uniref:XRE family transcriptional regulator n=1 Tax=Pseudoduganella dura TaxID=321982 RepID=A0A6I3XGY1_9BURK|nr:hypothetical protein [Pseudoduganella dura]MUI16134.1 hypothetical protein [Pseudoduganella dura]GGY15505.1 hypothetical protein GCM10007386_51860 [Pseudoduganella dura]
MTTFTNNAGIGANATANDDALLDYDPNRLLDHLVDRLHLKNDAALARMLDVAPPVISKIRHFRLAIGASLLIRMHEVSDISIGNLRILMGDRRGKFRVAFSQNDVPGASLRAA